jgi:hypothetical protein
VSETDLRARQGCKKLKPSRKEEGKRPKKTTPHVHMKLIIKHLTKNEPKTKPNFGAALAYRFRTDGQERWLSVPDAQQKIRDNIS